MNPATLIDGYKFSHRAQYPAGTTRVYSNWTPRESRVPGTNHVVFFGLQYFLRRYLDQEFGAFFATPAQEAASALRPVWRDGTFLVRENFADIRARLAGQ